MWKHNKHKCFDWRPLQCESPSCRAVSQSKSNWLSFSCRLFASLFFTLGYTKETKRWSGADSFLDLSYQQSKNSQKNDQKKQDSYKKKKNTKPETYTQYFINNFSNVFWNWTIGCWVTCRDMAVFAIVVTHDPAGVDILIGYPNCPSLCPALWGSLLTGQK